LAMANTPRQHIQQIVDDFVKSNGADIEILDAGCGCATRIRFPDSARIAGIDVDEGELARNQLVHDKILGDVQTYTTDKRYDITICWNLLEHLEHPDRAAQNLLTWTRPGGLVIITTTNVLSLKGLVTKYTPFAFHEWVYRHVYRYSGRPFRTYLKLCMSPRGLLDCFSGNEIAYIGYEDHLFRWSFLNYPYRFITAAARVLSLGRYDPSQAQLYMVARKTQQNTPVTG
jgi:SAM-dependent methyltransferase